MYQIEHFDFFRFSVRLFFLFVFWSGPDGVFFNTLHLSICDQNMQRCSMNFLTIWRTCLITILLNNHCSCQMSSVYYHLLQPLSIRPPNTLLDIPGTRYRVWIWDIPLAKRWYFFSLFFFNLMKKATYECKPDPFLSLSCFLLHSVTNNLFHACVKRLIKDKGSQI